VRFAPDHSHAADAVVAGSNRAGVAVGVGDPQCVWDRRWLMVAAPHVTLPPLLDLLPRERATLARLATRRPAKSIPGTIFRRILPPGALATHPAGR
jgi:hypothetical protein